MSYEQKSCQNCQSSCEPNLKKRSEALSGKQGDKENWI